MDLYDGECSTVWRNSEEGTMIIPHPRDIQAEENELCTVESEAQRFVQELLSVHSALRGRCVLVRGNRNPHLRMEFWHSVNSYLSEIQANDIRCCVVLILALRPPGELVQYQLPLGKDVLGFEIGSNAKSIVRKGPEHGPEKVY